MSWSSDVSWWELTTLLGESTPFEQFAGDLPRGDDVLADGLLGVMGTSTPSSCNRSENWLVISVLSIKEEIAVFLRHSLTINSDMVLTEGFRLNSKSAPDNEETLEEKPVGLCSSTRDATQ